MWRLITVAAGLSVAAGGTAAPAAKSADGPLPHFPVTVGDTATYRWTIADSTFETTERVTEVVRTRDGLRVTVERASVGKPAMVAQMDVSARGLTQVQLGGPGGAPVLDTFARAAAAQLGHDG